MVSNYHITGLSILRSHRISGKGTKPGSGNNRYYLRMQEQPFLHIDILSVDVTSGYLDLSCPKNETVCLPTGR